MEIIIAVSSIWFLTGLAWGARRIFGISPCSICAGVALTWLWILAGIYIGWLEAESWQLAAALAMGGSVVGIAYQLEKRPAFVKASSFAQASADKSAGKLLLWKALVIPLGFAAAWGALEMQWGILVFTAAAWAVCAFVFFRAPSQSAKETSPRAKELEEQMKNCC